MMYARQLWPAASPKPSLPRGQPVKICSPVRGFFTPS